MRKSKLGVAIIGCGAITRTHAAAIAKCETLELKGVYDRNESARHSFARESGVKEFSSCEEIYADDEADIVAICTPNGTHYELAKAALGHGKHVVAEKPLALKEEQCAELRQEAAKRGLTCAMIAQQRYFESMICVKKAIDEGLLGKIVMASLDMKYYRNDEYYNGSRWKGTIEHDGGVLMNQGIHGVDLLCYFMGAPERVYAEVATLDKDIEADDTAVAVLGYKGGAMGSITCTVCAYDGYPRKIEINGTRGSVVIEETEIVRWDIEGAPKPTLNENKQGATYKDSKLDDCTGHFKQYRDIAEHILYGKALHYTVDDAIATVGTICDVYKYRK